MARGFAVFTDNHVQQAVVDGLLAAGWDVMTTGDILRAFEALARKALFAYPIRFLTPPGTRAQRRERFQRTRPRGAKR